MPFCFEENSIKMLEICNKIQKTLKVCEYLIKYSHGKNRYLSRK